MDKCKVWNFILILLFALSIAENINYFLKYQRIQELYIEALSNVIIKDAPREDSNGINKEYQNLNMEILKDVNKKAGDLSQKEIITDEELGNITESAIKQTLPE